ncbi:MAG: hypothetical protein J07HQW2_00707 [Haloquadratum walsbyi J07HQW2]|jgi:hypothetical protein|uniref:Uncharacterized protein n=1 Tax=Haloquadratum walsbyi J07HQW2 TaxID=1238425 RepID=U1NC64_9EURY|nr:MAG: hypothetical protein J07HQW2_00707 [Haloquadratum walsbyi J07HQW2]
MKRNKNQIIPVMSMWKLDPSDTLAIEDTNFSLGEEVKNRVYIHEDYESYFYTVKMGENRGLIDLPTF